MSAQPETGPETALYATQTRRDPRAHVAGQVQGTQDALRTLVVALSALFREERFQVALAALAEADHRERMRRITTIAHRKRRGWKTGGR